MTTRKLRWVTWLLLVCSILGVFYSLAGYVMAGSFTISNPERLAHWRFVASVYGASMISCLLLAAGAAIYLIRTRQRSAPLSA